MIDSIRNQYVIGTVNKAVLPPTHLLDYYYY